MEEYTATHEIYDGDDGKLLYLYDISKDAVLRKDGGFYTGMGPSFTAMVTGAAENRSVYRFKEIYIELENK